jgi:hypothetical protein
MSKDPLRQFFENLVTMREAYASTEQDAQGGLTIEAAIDYAIALLEDPEELDRVVGVTTPPSEVSSDDQPQR